MIIAVDPGKMTGWARVTPNTLDSFQSGEQPLQDVLHFIHELMRIMIDPVTLEIVCEDFIFTQETIKKSRQMYSTEGIGALRFLCAEYDIPFYIQTPAAAKSFATNDKLKVMGWHTPGQGHANDAARHLLLHTVEAGLVGIRQFMQ